MHKGSFNIMRLEKASVGEDLRNLRKGKMGSFKSQKQLVLKMIIKRKAHQFKKSLLPGVATRPPAMWLTKKHLCKEKVLLDQAQVSCSVSQIKTLSPLSLCQFHSWQYPMQNNLFLFSDNDTKYQHAFQLCTQQPLTISHFL